MFITYKISHAPTQLTFTDMLDALYNNETITPPPPVIENTTHTYTRQIERIPEVYTPHIQRMLRRLDLLQNRIYDMADKFDDEGAQSMYETFFIPKRSGGLRQIDAPKPELKELLSDIKDLFERDFGVLAHNCAYAYVKGRSTKDAVAVHQANESKWFLKLDIKDFFPSCNKRFIMEQLKKLYPFKQIIEYNEHYRSLFSILIDICLLDDKLPQGTPMSPILTNLLMIPIDYEIQKKLWFFNNQRFKYTRYADDMLISCKYDFDWRAIQEEINAILIRNTPFEIKTAKTRYGSANGRNWNLGLMLNKDNQITIGYKKKQRLKAAIFSFMNDFTNDVIWSIMDVQTLLGNISYLKNIEPEYADTLINKYNEKFQSDFYTNTKQILNS